MNDVKTVFFIGRPGCGKGTQAKHLAEATGWNVFASGDLFREIAAQDTPVGRKVKAENDAGVLQPHWFAMYLYLKSLFSVPDDRGLIFDGFNRKVPEAVLVVESLAWLGRPFVILNINVSDDEARTRIAGRRELQNRADDHAVEERIKEYHENTEPAIEIFRDAGVLVDINGEQSPEEVAREIREALKIG